MLHKRVLLPLVLLSWIHGGAAAADAIDGKAVYQQHCAACHDSGAARTPTFATLQAKEAVSIVQALETGVMRVVGTFTLNGPERVAVAEYISGKKVSAGWASDAANMCAATTWPTSPDPLQKPHWNSWGVDQRNTRFQPAAQAGLTAAEVPALELQWAFGFPGETLAEAQPAVVDGRLFVGSRSGAVYALDAKTGCTHWVYHAKAAVKGPVLIAKLDAGRYAAFFGDIGAHAYAVDAMTGKEIWQIVADEHPAARLTGGFQLAGGRLYVPVSSLEEGLAADPNYACCTFRGSVMALNPATGGVIWKQYTIAEEPIHETKTPSGKTQVGPNGASVWSSPTIDVEKGLLYVATGDNYTHPSSPTSDGIVAMKLDTGAIEWVYQGLPGDAWNVACSVPDKANCPHDEGPDHDMGSSPILVSLADGKRVLLGGQKTGMLHAIDPDQKGKLLWQNRIAKGGILGGIEWGSASDGKAIFVAISDTRWAGGQFFGAEVALDPKAGGGIVAVDVATGKLLWQAPPVSCDGRERCSPGQTAAVTAIPGAVFSGAMSGVMRAFDATSGKVIWEYDTVKDYQTVNGAKGRGGAIDQAGVVVVDGWVYMNSGYANWGGHPGNVLLAFKPKPK